MSVECRITDQSGQLRWNVWIIRALFNEERNLHEYQGVGRDTTEKKEAARRINQYISEMDFFSRKLQEFIELSPDVDIYRAIGAGLEELLPDTAIAVSSYNPGSGTLAVKAVFGEKERDCVDSFFGKDFFKIPVPVDQNVPENVLTGKVYPVKKNLPDLLYPHVPADSCGEFSAYLNLGNLYSVGLVWQDLLLGNMTFALRKRNIAEICFSHRDLCPGGIDCSPAPDCRECVQGK